MSDRGGTRDRHLIIGAGPVGLAMAAALKKHFILFDVVDSGRGVGGNWRHGVYRSAHIVSSKCSTQYADFPMPDAYPDFPSATQMLEYLESFAAARDLLRYCEFGATVAKVARGEGERWEVTFKSGERRTYKGVIVCNGHHWDRRYPQLNGTFDGDVLHSKDYREPADLRGKRVLVVGGGNSGVDMACDAGRFGASCDISLKSGYWYLPKTFLGRPLTDIPLWGLPVFLQRLLLKGIVALSIGDYRRYGLAKPNHKLFERHPAFGTDLLNAIRLGRVKPRPGIESVSGKTVTFVDGTTGEFDLIIAATGFHTSFPFLDDGLVEVKDGVVQVYGGAFPVDARGLYIVGWAQARNGFGNLITPLADIYARLIAMQDQLHFPLGTVMESSFTQRLPTSHLVNPEQVKREIRLGQWTLWTLKLLDKRLLRKQNKAAEKDGEPVRA